MDWLVRHKEWDISAGGILMGIVNVTPDSFSDGGRFMSVENAITHALSLINEGAQIIDIGGESTRPGAEEVSAEEEVRRVLPVIRELRQQTDVYLSIDTRHSEVAEAALNAGVDIVNDISGLSDMKMRELCVSSGCAVVIMHMQGKPETMQVAPSYADVVREVQGYFEKKYSQLILMGMNPKQICWDPGIGFGKTLEHNLMLLANMKKLQVADRPILLGLSRKRMLATILHSQDAGKSALSTATMTVYGHLHGVHIHRVHDVRECRQALQLINAVEKYEEV